MYEARYFRELAARCYCLGRTCFDLDIARQLNDLGDELLLRASKLDGQEGLARQLVPARVRGSSRQPN